MEIIKNITSSQAPARLLPYLFLTIALIWFAAGCTPNNPYRAAEKGKNIFYATFTEPPKHLDPARSYSSDEYRLIAQIYEPPLQYHYLKRPYELIPLAAETLPVPRYLDRFNKPLPAGARPDKVSKAIYDIRIKKGVRYEDHPAFAKKEDGSPLYNGLTAKDLEGIDDIRDFPIAGTRELMAKDYVLEIKRLADPLVESPVLPILEKYILGLKELSVKMRSDLSAKRLARKKKAGSSYNQGLDERNNPINFDYDKYELPGAIVVDRYTYRII